MYVCYSEVILETSLKPWAVSAEELYVLWSLEELDCCKDKQALSSPKKNQPKCQVYSHLSIHLKKSLVPLVQETVI
jgi:hypothetical protein